MTRTDTTWKAGVASTIITPSEPMWLAGWAARTEPGRDTLADLHAKALALEESRGSRLVLLTVDLIAVSREIAAAVARAVQDRWGLPRERLMLCASHTHCGPEIRPDKVPFFRMPPDYACKISPYANWLTARLVEAAGAALMDMKPARLRARQTTAPFAQNRRGASVVDHDVPVLDVTADGRRLAVVFGYACHNTTMPPEDGRYCGDYAGFAQAALEAKNPGAVALFIAGAGADQNPEPRGSLDLTHRYGQTLAEAVQRRLATPNAEGEITGSLRVAYDEIALGFQPLPTREQLEAQRVSADLPMRTKAEYLLEKLDRGELFAPSHPCPLHVARLGDSLLLVALGGEPVIDYAREFKRRFAAPGRLVWVAGYANDMFGYVPTARVLREGGYEGNRSVLWSALPMPFAEDAEPRVIGGVERLVRQVEQDTTS